jgi:hypothetical protein
MNNITVKTLSTIDEFNSYYNQIFYFCYEVSNETTRDQTRINMGVEDWEHNNECLLYRIFKTNILINDNGSCSFIFDGDKIIGSSAVELWNKNVSSISKRTYVLKKYRKHNLTTKLLCSSCIKWAKDNHSEVKLYMTTYNEYVKDTTLSSVKNLMSKDLVEDWNFWPEWSLYPGTISIYNLEQYVVYKLIDKSIEDKPENIKELINSN